MLHARGNKNLISSTHHSQDTLIAKHCPNRELQMGSNTRCECNGRQETDWINIFFRQVIICRAELRATVKQHPAYKGADSPSAQVHVLVLLK